MISIQNREASPFVSLYKREIARSNAHIIRDAVLFIYKIDYTLYYIIDIYRGNYKEYRELKGKKKEEHLKTCFSTAYI